MEHNSANQALHQDDKLDAEFQVQKSPFLAWLDNFWYHYKWHTIVIVFFVTVLTLGVVQLFTRPSYDVNFVCAGTYRMNSEEHEKYAALLGSLLPEDYDGNGEKSVNIMAYQIYSDADVQEEMSKAEAESEKYFFNTKNNTDEFDNFSKYTMTGDCSVLLLSPHLYESLALEGRLLPVASLYEGRDLPAGVTKDGYGVAIAQTHFYQYHPEAQVLSEDMILCILQPLVWGGNSKDAAYARDKAFFCAMIDYQVKE